MEKFGESAFTHAIHVNDDLFFSEELSLNVAHRVSPLKRSEDVFVAILHSP